jgi:hypothetical protein
MSAGQQIPQESVPKLDAVGLANVSAVVQASMTSVQQALAAELDRVGQMPPSGVADMVQLQYEMANYTVAGQTLSAIMKDMSDTLKAVTQHIG